MGVSTSPHSRSWVIPETSPAPFSTKPPPTTRSSNTLVGLGRIAVTPVRTGPLPTRSGPAPRVTVEWPTRTPATSVMAFQRPGL
ncbi:hypothetical protein PSR1_03332 [Anaeromyxobacter sp. PSR-1]|nr:hypothetical protein PSR1_03332 [Anaeromyxobacter sp. PSR-1]